MKKGGIRKNKISFAVFILFLVTVLTISFVFAAHVITNSEGENSYSVDEDVGYIYNITVNNTDAVETANITEVNITIPSTFSFLADSNETDAGTHTFTNTSTVLSWNNDGLVMNLTWKSFWFNATASTPGDYNLTVSTTNGTGTETTNISVTINDTSSPSSIEFVSPTEINNSNLSQSNIEINVTAEDNGIIDTIIARLFNSTRVEINSSTSSTSPLYINFAGLSDGVYYFNATVNDTFGEDNSTSTRTVTLDTTNPSVSFSCDASLINKGGTLTCSCSGSDSTSGVQTTSYTENPSTSTSGTFSTTCTVTDYSGNSASSSVSYTVVSSGSGGYPTFTPRENELEKGYNKIMYENWKILFILENNSHIFKVEDIKETTVEISISSETQEATLSVGQEKKFELSGDNYYDISVKLNSIDTLGNDKANFTIQTINKMVDSQAQEEGETAEDSENKGDKTSKFKWLRIVIGCIVLILIAMGIGYKKQRW